MKVAPRVHRSGRGLCLGLVAACGSATGQSLVEVIQDSQPAGIIQFTSQVQTGVTFSTVTALSVSGGYSFVGWRVDGIEQREASGEAINPVAFVVLEPERLTALYVATTQDSDADGIPDWHERRYFGTLAPTATSDSDADGFPLSIEARRGYHPQRVDVLRQGGVSRRKSPALQVSLAAGRVEVVERSDPPGAVNSSRILSTSSPYTTSIAPESFGDNRFTGWYSADDVRLDDPRSGRVATVIVGNMPLLLTARYLPDGLDADADTLPDWYERYHFDTLALGASADPDGDGFPLAVEWARGYDGARFDRLAQGGVSRRRSVSLRMEPVITFTYREQSTPAGTWSSVRSLPAGTLLQGSDLRGLGAEGLRFAYWSIDGDIQRGEAGAILPSVEVRLDRDITAIATFLPENLDADADGLPDWWEWSVAWNPELDAASDPDRDGITLGNEFARGYSPHFVERLATGGISRRRSATQDLNLQPFERVLAVREQGVLAPIFSFDAVSPEGDIHGIHSAPALGDWDGDGDLDLFLFRSGGLLVYESLGSRSLSNLAERTADFAALASEIEDRPRPVATMGDLDRDGRADLVLGGGGATIRSWRSSGHFAGIGAEILPSLEPGSSFNLPALGDLDGDGWPDLLVVLADGSQLLYRHTGNASSPFAATTENPLGAAVPGASGVGIADVDGDGRHDVLVADEGGRIWHFASVADGTFRLVSRVWGGSGRGFATAPALAVGDFDRDGDVDALVGSAAGALLYLRDPRVGRPLGLRALPGADSVVLEWIPGEQPRLRGYHVYRTIAGETALRLTDQAVGLPTFRDFPGKQEGEIGYEVRAVSYSFTPGNSARREVVGEPSDLVMAEVGSVQVALRSTRGKPGGVIRVPLSIANALGLAGSGLRIVVQYDPAMLRPISQVQAGRPTATATGLGAEVVLSDNGAEAEGLLAIAGTGGSFLGGEGRALELAFQLADTADVGTSTSLSILEASLFAESGASVEVVHGGVARIEVADRHGRGDVDGSGHVDDVDLALLRSLTRQQARAPTPDELMAGDLNGDGRLGLGDVVLLLEIIRPTDS